MASLRSGLRSTGTHRQSPSETLETLPTTAADSGSEDNDEDDDDDDDGIPNAPFRPSSSRGSDPDQTTVSLGRPPAKSLATKSLRLPRPATRRSVSRIDEQTNVVQEKPQKRRKTIHDPYSFPSSPPPHQEDGVGPGRYGPVNLSTTRQLMKDNDDDDDDDDDADPPPGLLGKMTAAFIHAKDAGATEFDTAGEANRSADVAADEPVLSPDRDIEGPALNDALEAEHAPSSEEELSESLFVQQESGYDVEEFDGPADGEIAYREVDVEVKRVTAASVGVLEGEHSDYQSSDLGAQNADDADFGIQDGSEKSPSISEAAHGTKDVDDLESLALDGIDEDEDHGATSDSQLDIDALFQRDVASFAKHYDSDRNYLVTFHALPEDWCNTVRIRYEDFRTCILLMKGDSWTGHGRIYWVSRPLSSLEPTTTPGRALYSVIGKLERLCSVVPKAPQVTSQTKFLQEHQTMLSHYLSQIQLICQHITQQRLRRAQHEGSKETRHVGRKRNEMLVDTMRHIIPMLLHCANSIWSLAGKDDHNTFTKCTIDLFEHVLFCVKQLCEAVVRVLVKLAGHGEPPSSKGASQPDERTEQAKTLAFKLVLAINEIRRARDALAEEGVKQQLRQEKQAVLMQQMKKNQEATRLQLEQLRARRIARSSQQASQASMTTSRSGPSTGRNTTRQTNDPNQRTVLSSQSRPREVPSGRGADSRVQTAESRSISHRFRKWNREEQAFLLSKIQDAYVAVEGVPQLPDIDGVIRRELNRPVKDILHQTEVLLTLMLRKTGQIEDDAERQSWVKRLMSTYDGVGLD
ncbi:uncharacterized protein B0I36DRAFT_328520 [Microdochium trichocladiopsis]|uniref:Uncharacterized protein n=1 Tax=Microdochium trichocladiopsis TaxID=1682393 RepID=A0A9P8Y369_9PEZI|nr:uncharacterized protein B0I36DRAFT_328520 [Microdochium trichocladiopsis]KAH7028053.1 hypothetical protein B0I36DRAFT_328520 [Microdochium trichocladiopsis]